MWHRVLLDTLHNDLIKEVLCIVSNIIMVIAVLYALLTMEVEEISFVYANF